MSSLDVTRLLAVPVESADSHDPLDVFLVRMHCPVPMAPRRLFEERSPQKVCPARRGIGCSEKCVKVTVSIDRALTGR